MIYVFDTTAPSLQLGGNAFVRWQAALLKILSLFFFFNLLAFCVLMPRIVHTFNVLYPHRTEFSSKCPKICYSGNWGLLTWLAHTSLPPTSLTTFSPWVTGSLCGLSNSPSHTVPNLPLRLSTTSWTLTHYFQTTTREPTDTLNTIRWEPNTYPSAGNRSFACRLILV